jgi:ABC-2 type transport system permease protein
MSYLGDMIWIESRKAWRSRIPLISALGFLIMPIASAFLIFVIKNPQLARQLGLVSAKANILVSDADWPAYLKLVAEACAMGGFFLFCLITSWTFGREFADHTVKDLLAVPVPRLSLLLAKFFVVTIWSIALAVEIYLVSMVVGWLLRLDGGTSSALLDGSIILLIAVALAIVSVTPFAFLASVGRGYLLPLGIVVLIAIVSNLVAVAGWGDYFPWSVAGMVTQGEPLAPVSYVIVLLTGLVGILLTYLWWMRADQSR